MARKPGINVTPYLEQAAALIGELRNVMAYINSVDDIVKAGGYWPPYVSWPAPLSDKDEEAVKLYKNAEFLLSMVDVANMMTERYEEKWTDQKVRNCLRRHELSSSLQWLRKAKECGLL
jgi:hypothetical protein